MEKETCITCRKPKATLICEVCQEPVCKGCIQFLEPTAFSFLKEVAENLTHSRYCSPCYDENVVPALDSYQETLERARNLHFFFNSRRRPVPLIRKSKTAVHVEECNDRDETILRLAFMAAVEGYNSVVEAEVVSKKLRNEGYQKSQWQGTGIPADIDVAKFERSTYGADE